MKILIISDSHGHIANLKQVLDIGKKMKVGAVIHCGDWDNLESFRAAQTFGLPIYSVLGNADVDPKLGKRLKVKSKRFDENFLTIKLGGRKIGIIHNIKNLKLKIENFDVVFSGHYHSKEEKNINWTKFIRPGALINGINFAVYETVSGTIEFVNELIIDTYS